MRKRHRKGRITTVRIGETPTPERRRQNGGVTSEIVDRDVSGKILIKRYKAVYECPLDVYLAKDRISELEYLAGLKFRHAYFRAVLGVRVDDIGSGNRGDIEMSFVTPIYSEQLLREAYEVLSPVQKAIIINVCGHDEVAGTKDRVQSLHRGLEKLCDVWNVSPEDSKFLQ